MNSFWAFDIEVYRNFLSFTAVNAKNSKDVFQIYSFGNKVNIDFLKELHNFITNKIDYLVGYNNIKYDDIIVTELITKYLKKEEVYHNDIFLLGQSVIENEEENHSVKTQSKYYKRIDLMRMLRLDKLKISLKHCGVVLFYNNIQDLPIKFYETIKEDQIDILLKYNLNDVYLTIKVLKYAKDQLKFRFDLSNLYNSDFLNDPETKIADKVLTSFYLEKSAIVEYELKQLKTDRNIIYFNDIIDPNITFTSKKGNDFLNKLKNIIWRKDIGFEKYIDGKFTEQLNIGNKFYSIGIGGLHSIDKTIFYESNNKYKLIDADVASFYPKIIINLNICPEHLEKSIFLDIYKEVFEKRILFKKEGNVTKAQVLKLILNLIFGKFNDKYSWLHDLQCTFQVTVNGQLYLLSLIDELESNNIEIFSANTDGITCKVPPNKEELYKEICSKWEKKYNFSLEYVNYKKIYMRDVNNYCAITDSGKVKTKGDFVEIPEIQKQLDAPIIKRALVNYLIYDKPISETINESSSIYDFLYSIKSDSKFEMVELIKNEKDYVENVLQKTNRFFVCNDSRSIFKRNKNTKEIIRLFVGKNLKVANKIVDPVKEIENVDKVYYISQAVKLANEIKQFNNLF
jgi:hypothetical protein